VIGTGVVGSLTAAASHTTPTARQDRVSG